MTKLTLRSLRSRAGHVHVTTQHIREGVPNDAQQCAIAVALEGLLPSGAEVVAVNHEYITVGQEQKRWHAATPAPAADFIIAFDNLEDDASELDSLKATADAGLLQWELHWTEGPAPAPAGCTEAGE